MNLIDLALHIPAFINKQDCESIIDFYEKQSEDKKYYDNYSDNYGVDKKVSGRNIEITKDDYVFSMINTYVQKAVESWIEHIKGFKMFDDSKFQNSICSAGRYRLIKYSSGERIEKHTDIDTNSRIRSTVRGSCIFTFSSPTDYEGGEFELWNKEYSIKFGKGDLFIFPADAFWMHSTALITNGSRYSFNTLLHPHMGGMNG